ncbi:MAG: hypothetical protein BYD32DRAFT_428120 [Podila humilis]|nr:MAG: hypothetical protein BYD32DRAFT_428120 [Podila humilis]
MLLDFLLFPYLVIFDNHTLALSLSFPPSSFSSIRLSCQRSLHPHILILACYNTVFPSLIPDLPYQSSLDLSHSHAITASRLESQWIFPRSLESRPTIPLRSLLDSINTYISINHNNNNNNNTTLFIPKTLILPRTHLYPLRL